MKPPHFFVLVKNLLRFLLFSSREIVKGVTYKWFLLLIDFFKTLSRYFHVKIASHKLGHFSRDISPLTCMPIEHPSFSRPDPLIYSQQYLLSLGLAVTWDNPDIVLLLNGVVVPEGNLLPNTEYEIDATIWNNSFDAPIVGLVVNFAYLSFGTGTTLNFIGTKAVNLGVKGGVDHPAHARIAWTTPPAGHYCIQVHFEWADDLNPANNMGQNNVEVVSAHSPAEFKFDLRNKTGTQTTYTFEFDTYVLPPLQPCEERSKKRSNAEKWSAIQALHDRSKYPIPSDWTVTVLPDSVNLSPGQEVPIQVTINPPPSFTGTKAFNIHTVMENSTFVGGVTAYVTKS